MSPLAADQVPRLRPDTRYRVVGGQAVVIVQDAGEALVLNEVGSRILEQVDGVRSVAEIVARLTAEYEVGVEEISRDIGEYLDELATAGIVELGGSSTAADRQRQ